MKKIFLLILAMMLATCAAALAEETASPLAPVDLGAIELGYEPTWVAFENGMQIAVPSDWTEAEVSDEMAATGVFYLAQNPDATVVAGIAYRQLGITDLDALATMFASTHPSLGIVVANGVTMLACDAADGSYSALITLDGQGGMYMLTIAPAIQDEALKTTAVAMMTTLGPVAAEAPAN
jgi:hypothetical protein